MDGSLFETAQPSRFRNSIKPSDAVNKVWDDLELIWTFPITAEDVRRLGKDPEVTSKFPPEYGLGDDAYVAQLDIFHQIHCLNLLRHTAWGEYDRDGKTAKRPYSELHWLHVSHCVEIIRENVMCNANLDVITYQWVETQTTPYPDFDLNKKCVNADVLIEWQMQKAVIPERGRNFTAPPGAKQIPISDEYYRIFGVEKTVNLHAGEAHEHQYKDPA